MSNARAGLAVALTALAVAFAVAPTGSAIGPQLLPAFGSDNRDGDGDKVVDGLERKLATRPAAAQDVLVLLRSAASRDEVAALAARVDGLVVRRTLELVPAFSARASAAQIEELRLLPEVERIEPNGRLETEGGTGHAEFGVTKAQLDVPGLDGNADGKPAEYSKNDLVAAVLDTGIDTSHVALDGGKVIGWKDVVDNRPTPYDDNGHGTGVASILAGDGDPDADRRYRGVVPGAALVGVKVTPADGVARMDLVIAGLQWVVANKTTYNIRVVNLSLGAEGCWDGTEAVSQAVNAAVDAGLVLAVAAGNGGPGICTIKSPGAAEKAITVANMASLGSGGLFLNWSSSRGPTADGRLKPDIAGPGVLAPLARAGSTNEYDASTGTSMSSPFVAGVALLMLEQNPSLSPQQIKTTMRTTAEDWGRGALSTVAGTTGPDYEYGAGRLDAYAALKAVGAPLTTGPSLPTHLRWEGTVDAVGAAATYPLNVRDTTAPIAVTMIVPYASWTKDLDMQLIDPAGNVVATGANPWADRQETISYLPVTTGAYTLRVFSKAGSGPFYADISGPIGAVPAVVPTVAASTSNATAGSPVTITWSGVASPATTDWIGMHETGAPNTTIRKWVFTSSCTQTAAATAKASGSCTMTVPTTPGTYEFRLFARNTYTRLATSGVVTVRAAPQPVTLTASVTTVKVGQPITVVWSGVSPPATTDWIGLHAAGAADTSIKRWVFTSSCTQTTAATAKASGSCAMTMPTTAGTYELRLFAKNTYTRLATGPTVTVKP